MGKSADKTRPKIIPLEELEEGQTADCFVLLVSKELRQTRNGNPYYLLTVRGRERQVSIYVWQESEFFELCEREWSGGQYLKIRGTYRQTEYGPQLQLERARVATEEDRKDGFDPSQFVPASRFDPQEMFERLCELAEEHIEHAALRRLVVRTLERYAEELKQLPAARRMHHAVAGGFLEHVLSVTETVIYLVDKYSELYADLDPPISKPVAVAGAILHDIGKLRELDVAGGTAKFSVQGHLLGHMVLGRDIVREVAAEEVPELDQDILLEVEHIIAAHQARPEWGAVVEPRTIECLIVHYADDVDAKVNMMAEARRRDRSDGPFTTRDNPLRRHVYKGSKQRASEQQHEEETLASQDRQQQPEQPLASETRGTTKNKKGSELDDRPLLP